MAECATGGFLKQRRSQFKGTQPDFRLACGPSCLFPFEHQDVRRALIRGVHSLRQSLEIGRKLDLLSVRDLALDFVGDFQSTLFSRRAEYAESAGTSGPTLG